MQTEQTHAAFNRTLDQLDVVVIDDAKPMQMLLRSMLNTFRVARIRMFDNAQIALQSMIVDPPNLIITDWRMGHVDGIQLIRAIRSKRMGALVAVPAIVLTGEPTRRLVEASVRVSAHAVLAKPLAPATLEKRLKAIMRDSRTFQLNEETGDWILSGSREVLAAQRSRWQRFSTIHTDRADLMALRSRPRIPPVEGQAEPVAKLPLQGKMASFGIIAARRAAGLKDARPKKAAGLGISRHAAASELASGEGAGQGGDKAA